MTIRQLLLMLLIFALPATTSAAEPFKILVLGDSLTEGYGVAKEAAFPALLEEQLKTTGYPNIQVINGGVSGDTTAGGLSRFKNWYLRAKPSLLVIALGSNDGLRGLKPEQTKNNLRAIVKLAKDNGIPSLLMSCKLPPNYSHDYIVAFETIFPALAKELKLPKPPFLLEEVAANPQLNLEDGIHPNEKGHRIMAANLQRHLVPLLPLSTKGTKP